MASGADVTKEEQADMADKMYRSSRISSISNGVALEEEYRLAADIRAVNNASSAYLDRIHA